MHRSVLIRTRERGCGLSDRSRPGPTVRRGRAGAAADGPALALVCAVGACALGACEHDSVGPGFYGVAGDASVDASGAAPAGDAELAADSSLPAVEAAPGLDAGVPTSPDCDMNGRWLVAQRVLAQALGQTQASHNWFYYEVRQDGDQLTVTKGLHCGFEVVHISSLGADVSSRGAWPAFLTHDSDTGRRGTMAVTSSGCQLDFEKRYTVRGATASYYMDPSQALPTASQQASGPTPGWEDWDGDGNPGITLVVSGAASGDLYCAQRDWNQYSGAVARQSTAFDVPVTWDSEQDALGYSGSSLVTESAVPATDPTQHYVWFVRLGPTQATGDDTAICAAVRSLVPTLAPAADQ